MNSWPIVSQDPSYGTTSQGRSAQAEFLPELIKMWQHIEKTTGFRWKSTSYWRNSPSHRRGYALDIAPDIAASANHAYAVTHMSDPVLYKREKLMRLLQRAASTWDGNPSYTYGVFVEPDHIHLHLLTPDKYAGQMRVVKWKVVKPAYSDSEQRMKLNMI